MKSTEGNHVSFILYLTQSVVTSHLQVGVNVNLDAKFLERDYGVEVANTVDLRTHARECWVETPSRSLAGIVSSLLGQELPKDPTIRLSRWSAALTDAQVIHVFFYRWNYYICYLIPLSPMLFNLLGSCVNNGSFCDSLALPSQVQYACLDAFASVLVYLEIEKLKDPIRCPAPTALPPGTQVCGRITCTRGAEAFHF